MVKTIIDPPIEYYCCLKKNQNASRPSEDPPVRGKKMSKRLVRWNQRLQIQNLFVAFKRVELPDGNNIGSTV